MNKENIIEEFKLYFEDIKYELYNDIIRDFIDYLYSEGENEDDENYDEELFDKVHNTLDDKFELNLSDK